MQKNLIFIIRNFPTILFHYFSSCLKALGFFVTVRTLPYGAKDMPLRETTFPETPASVHALTLCLPILSFGCLADVDGEHHNLRGPWWTSCCLKSTCRFRPYVAATEYLPLDSRFSFIDLLPVRTCYMFRTNNTWGIDRCSQLHKNFTNKHYY